MANVRLLDTHEIQDPELQALIRQAEERGAPDPNVFRVLGHTPELCKKFYAFWTECFNRGLLDHRLKELIRVKMSRTTACMY